jgi:hypothetical protein
MVGLAMFIGVLMSPAEWGWWVDAHSAQGREVDGLVYYSVNGMHYTVADPLSFVGSKPRGRTVYYLGSQPSDGSLHNIGNELLDWSLTAGPGAIGLVLLATGFAPRYRLNGMAGDRDLRDSFGHGIPSETIRDIVSRNRHPGP